MSTLVVKADLSSGVLASGTDSAAVACAHTFRANVSAGSVIATGPPGLTNIVLYGSDLGGNNLFIEFDTSGVPTGERITYASIAWHKVDDLFPLGGPVFEVRAYDWGASVTTADYVGGSGLEALPLVAYLDLTDLDIGDYTFIDVALRDYIVPGGVTRLLIANAGLRLGSSDLADGAIDLNTDPPVLTVRTDTDPFLNGTLGDAAGGGITVGSTSDSGVGTQGVYDGLLAFDTSALGAGATIESAVLTVYGYSYYTGELSNTPVDVRLYDWGEAVTADDWVTDPKALTLLAHGTVVLDDGSALDLTSDALAALIDPEGMTRVLARSSASSTMGASPRAADLGAFIPAGAYGEGDPPEDDDRRPYLTIEYTTSSGPGPRSQSVVIA